VKCYKDHNKDCTESFYKENIEKKLKSDKIRDPKEIKKMNDLLLKYHKQDILEECTESGKKFQSPGTC